MKGTHVVTGMPRAGSTLLCNVLNQNEKLFASSTSPLCGMISALAQGMSTQPEVMSELIMQADSQRVLETQRALADGWYRPYKKKTVFDKGRGWAIQSPLFQRLWPKGLIVCLVRNPVQVFASIEERHEQTAELQPGPLGGMAARATKMMEPDGLIGSCVAGVEDLLRRNPDQCLIVDYDKFVSKPGEVIERIYTRARIKKFKHQFDNVESTATDVDALYHFKFPHEGMGKIEARAPRTMDRDIANHIMSKCQFYNATLGFN